MDASVKGVLGQIGTGFLSRRASDGLSKATFLGDGLWHDAFLRVLRAIDGLEEHGFIVTNLPLRGKGVGVLNDGISITSQKVAGAKLAHHALAAMEAIGIRVFNLHRDLGVIKRKNR